MFAVFDLDDTLGCTLHRRHLIIPAGQTYADYNATNPPGDFKPDWDAFFAARIDDPPIQVAIDLLLNLYHTGHEVEVWTAAREDFRDLTLEWLELHKIPGSLLTHMRPKNNFVKTTLLKEAWLLEHKPDIIFDDHIGICEMARRHGVYACAVGSNAY
jgi:hypothetical protein